MPVKTFTLRGADPEDAAWRVLLVPHAGAGASAGAAFAEHVPDDWAVATARLPGRESRVREPVGGLAELTADVAATARALPGSGPLLVVGVCSGAVIALEAVRVLQRDGDVPVSGFVAVSQWAVTEKPDPERRLLRDTDEPGELLDILREFGGVPESLAANEEMLGLLLPTIVADMRAVEEYSSSPDPLLACPLLTVFGDEDPLCPEERVEDWDLFSDRTRTVWLPGGHLLLTESPELLARAVADSVGHFVAPHEEGPAA
ncbi:alpha/beta fold hydrolase [Streptomyces sp. SID8379]|uniref:thioesterase II family protein n=1 Tax=unclassified Streptomyces TaxID=2593676 RepID=UPI00036C9F89|nr:MULTISPECIES: alpha/beta fold hydrolase [unclassified Streptomyces]MYW67354.1 alpha/beta fold hydrolase [Streptomyces sp. SID8379]